MISDERALVQGAAKLGWVLSSRTPETLTVNFYLYVIYFYLFENNFIYFFL